MDEQIGLSGIQGMYTLTDHVKAETTMEERLRQAENDFTESLQMLKDKLQKGGILTEMESPHLREQSPCRTPLEGAVAQIENHGWMVRDLTNSIVL